jgi:hypothetical protein
VNLFSIHQALKKGHKISIDKIIILISKELTGIALDRVFKTKGGKVSGRKMIAYNNSVACIALNRVLK